MMMQKIALQLHADDIIYKPEDIAELEEYPPDQRGAMVAAIMKEIGDLCKIGVFSLEMILRIQVLVISGEWETRGNAMDFQSPSPGGALF